ncbi:MAG: trehalose-phosphatase, partial [Dehalococcoidia bacterium]
VWVGGVRYGSLGVLDRLATVAKVAIVTGRDLNTARRMMPCAGVVVIGSHGLEASVDGVITAPVDRPRLAAALEAAEQQVISAVPSAFLHVERKAISTAFHFRKAPELELELRKALSRLPKGLRLREGRMVLEVVPDAEGGKGMALEGLVKHLRAKSLLVMGDDATDVAMFVAARGMRERGLSALVAGISSGPETPAEIEAQADVMLASTDEALEGLEILARALGV